MAKPIDDLKPSDFEAHPIWEYSMDEEEGDETWVRPYTKPAVPASGDYQVYHVATDLTAATGKAFVGFMSVCEGDLHDTAPYIVGEGENYWIMDMPPSRKERQAFQQFFGATYTELFPMRWVMRAKIGNEKTVRSGEYIP